MDTRRVDLVMFMGQSNMAGRGATCDQWPQCAPEPIPGAGYEYRAVSDPMRLSPLCEPFGVNENRPGGIDETLKTGSMATAFVNSCFSGTGVPVVGVSASKGGSVIAQWTPGSPYLTDALERLRKADGWLSANGYCVRHRFVLWCQGESDADAGTPREAYFRDFHAMLAAVLDAGVEVLFMVRIGQCNLPGSEERYSAMIEWQDELAQTTPQVVMASTCLKAMRAQGMMKDAYHYYQIGYNLAGKEAGDNVSAYVQHYVARHSSRNGGGKRRLS